MKQHTFLLALYVSELNLWLRFGSKFIDIQSLLPVQTSRDGSIDFESACLDALASRVPDHDDDGEVVVALLRIEDIAQYIDLAVDGVKLSRCEVQVEQVIRIYPVTDRGRALLEGKLDARIRLASPLLEGRLRSTDASRDRGLALRGGKALLAIAGLESEVPHYLSLFSRVWEALRDRDEREVGLRKGDRETGVDLVADLICYERSGTSIPNTDYGILVDFGMIFKDLARSKKAKSWLDEYRRAVQSDSDLKKFDLAKSYGRLTPLFNSLDSTVLDLSPLTCLTFLKLRHNLFEVKSLWDSSFVKLRAAFEKHTQEFALAVGMVGSFFGFSKFRSDYYSSVSLPMFDAQFDRTEASRSSVEPKYRAPKTETQSPIGAPDSVMPTATVEDKPETEKKKVESTRCADSASESVVESEDKPQAATATEEAPIANDEASEPVSDAVASEEVLIQETVPAATDGEPEKTQQQDADSSSQAPDDAQQLELPTGKN